MGRGRVLSLGGCIRSGRLGVSIRSLRRKGNILVVRSRVLAPRRRGLTSGTVNRPMCFGALLSGRSTVHEGRLVGSRDRRGRRGSRFPRGRSRAFALYNCLSERDSGFPRVRRS